jgi:hypothetical protein
LDQITWGQLEDNLGTTWGQLEDDLRMTWGWLKDDEEHCGQL